MKKYQIGIVFMGGFTLGFLVLGLTQYYYCLNYYNSTQNTNINTILKTSLENNKKITMDNLDKTQLDISNIASYTAVGNIEKLTHSLNAGLDDGLSVNQIKEILLQSYAYVGFPRSLNGMGALQGVLKTREEKGIKDNIGEEAKKLGNNENKSEIGANKLKQLTGTGFSYPFYNGMESFLKEHLFADIFSRGVLTDSQRELVTISILSSLSGVDPQLGSHLNIGLNSGLTPDQLRDVISNIKNNLGNDNTKILENVLSTKNTK